MAIPFESFVSSARTVIGVMTTWLLRSLAFVLRLIGNLGFYAGRLIVNVYDLFIFPALWVEGLVAQKFFQPKEANAKEKVSEANEPDSASRMEGAPRRKEAVE